MENRTTADNAARKSALKAFVDKGVPVGLVGYLEGEPVAWCSVGPRGSFTRLSPDQDDTEEGVWSVTCFFIRRDARKSGLSGRMLDEAIKFAKSKGAKVLEAYPVDPDSPSYRFMGFKPLYAARHFKEIGRAGSRRHVVRLTL
jgi:GNAT superfamily N-acetyltransferase